MTENGGHAGRNDERGDAGGEEEIAGNWHGFLFRKQLVDQRPNNAEPALMQGAENRGQDAQNRKGIQDENEAESDDEEEDGIEHEDDKFETGGCRRLGCFGWGEEGEREREGRE